MDDKSGDDYTGEVWDDRGEEINQEEADQDVADEVSEEVDSRGKVMRSEKNYW